jgi:hypothetical protein
MVPTHDEARMARPGLVLSSIEEALVVLSRRAEAAEGALAACRASLAAERGQGTEDAREIDQLKQELARTYGELAGLKDRVDDLQASEAELVAAPLRRKIEQQNEIIHRQDRALAQREAEAAKLSDQLGEETERADANKAWAERAEGHLAAKSVELTKTQDALIVCRTSREMHRGNSMRRGVTLLEIGKLVNSDEIRPILAWSAASQPTGAHSRTLADTIRAVRKLISEEAEGGPPAQG